MRSRGARTIVALALLLALLVASTLAAAAGLEGKKAPPLAAKGTDGKPVPLATLAAGRPVIVVFWASWCPYCEALLPHLAKLQSAAGKERAAVIAVSVWEDAGVKADAVLKERGFDFISIPKGDKQAKPWGVKGTPGLFVVDRSGKVVYDRNARVLKAAGEAAPASSMNRKATAAKSAEMWAADVKTALDA
ncbi:MAG TPA: TlpA disulfide reductase family protein, partial [Xanthomonadales bacterium]|nr:TlpA disulfide reductase family protein [Xanthomonadales bacterium]